MAKRVKSVSVGVDTKVSEPVKSIYDKIRDGDYDSKVPYPCKSEFKITEHVKTQRLGVQTVVGFDEDAYKAAMKAYAVDNSRVSEQFRNDAMEYVGISENPKRDKCWSLACDLGHSSGYSDVLSYLKDLADLIKD